MPGHWFYTPRWESRFYLCGEAEEDFCWENAAICRRTRGGGDDDEGACIFWSIAW